MRTIPSRRILFVISLILCCTVCAQEEKEFNVDSELYSYFQRCQENVGDSKVLHMADTLYWMSEKKGDQRMQAVALTLKLDHIIILREMKKTVSFIIRRWLRSSRRKPISLNTIISFGTTV